MGSGLTEEQMELLTNKMKKVIIEEHGKIIKVKPEIVVEIGYEEIQQSSKYPSGYALRFPKLLNIREPVDKKPKDADTIHDIQKLFKMQKKR
jgi:DNA ligase 1